MSSKYVTRQLELDIPVNENEPKPWVVKVWRYFTCEEFSFLTKEEAISFYEVMLDENCWPEGVYSPDGELIHGGY